MPLGSEVAGEGAERRFARVGVARYADALALAHVREMNFTGKPMNGYVYVDPPGLVEDSDLAAWVSWCADHVAGLPAKVPRTRR